MSDSIPMKPHHRCTTEGQLMNMYRFVVQLCCNSRIYSTLHNADTECCTLAPSNTLSAIASHYQLKIFLIRNSHNTATHNPPLYVGNISPPPPKKKKQGGTLLFGGGEGGGGWEFAIIINMQ